MALVWTPPEIEKLRAAYQDGKYAAAERAFPHLTRGQVGAGIRRWVLDFQNGTDRGTNAPLTPEEARRRLAGFDADAFVDGVARLLENRYGQDERKSA